MAYDMVELARRSKGVAPILYDQFREVGNVLSGMVYSYEARALEKGDEASAEVFRQERTGLRTLIDSTDPTDIDAQASLMAEWRGIVRALRVA